MDLRITHNLAASIALGGMRSASVDFTRAAERLSVGKRIHRASDAPGTFVGIQNLRSQIVGTNAALQNVLVARNSLDIAQDGMGKIYDRLVKLRSTALKALGSDIGISDRGIFQDEADFLLDDIDRIVRETSHGGRRLLDGSGDFQIDQSDKAFDDIRVKRLTFNAQSNVRDFEVNVTRLAERASIVTNLDLASLGSMTSGANSILSIGGKSGGGSITITEDMSAQGLVHAVNAQAERIGVYASSFISNGADSGFVNLTTADLTLGGGNQFTFDLDGQAISGTATQDAGGGSFTITHEDLQRALNSADQGHFSVIGGDQGFTVRRAGATDFTIDNFRAVFPTLITLNLFNASINGVEPPAARMVSSGLGFNATGQTMNFDVEVFGAGGASTQSISVTSTDANFVNGTELDTALNGIADVTYMGVDAGGQDIYLFEAQAGVQGFQFKESGGGNDASNLGLLSDSGGGKGFATTGMAVLALYSNEFGSDQSVSLRNAGNADLRFNQLNESNGIQNGIAQSAGEIRGFGIDAEAEINNTRLQGHGFHFNYASDYASIEVDLSARFGEGSRTNTINRALNLNYADPTTQNFLAFRSLSNFYEGTSYQLTDLNDTDGTQFQADGIIDRVEFQVQRYRAGSQVESGLGVQLTGNQGGKEYIGIRSFDTAHLGGGLSAEGPAGTMGTRLVRGAGTISQIRRGGSFSLEGSRDDILDALAVIDRALEQTLASKTQVGLYQTLTLDGTRDFLAGLETQLAQAQNDLESVDIAKEVTTMSLAQLKVQAATNVLAQANTNPQTLLTLLR